VHGDFLVHWEAEPAEPTLKKGTVYPNLLKTEQDNDFKRAVVHVSSRHLQRRIITYASVNYRPPKYIPGARFTVSEEVAYLRAWGRARNKYKEKIKDEKKSVACFSAGK
jgi:hypothetical protein